MRSGQLQPRRRGGRPRKATTEHAVLTAVRELLAEQGYSATSVQAISAKAGVPISSIYRRWPTRVMLIEEAAAIVSPEMADPTGDLLRDLLSFAEDLHTAFTAPATRAAVPFLLGEYQVGHLGRPPEEWVRHSWRPLLANILERAEPRGASASIDPGALFDLMLGSVLVQLYVPTAVHDGAVDSMSTLCHLVVAAPASMPAARSEPE
jgi:AcrR family transcriptional regulator